MRAVTAERATGISCRIEDSAVSALNLALDGNLRSILLTMSNCVRYAIEVEHKTRSVIIDEALVQATLADIKRTSSAGEEGTPGKLKSFLLAISS